MVLLMLIQINMSPHLKRVEQDKQDKGITLTNLLLADITNTIFLGLCCTNSFFFFSVLDLFKMPLLLLKATYRWHRFLQPPPPPIPPIPFNLLTAAATPPPPPPGTQVNPQVPPPPAIQVNLQLPPPPLPPLQVASPPPEPIQLNPQAPPPADAGNVENVLDIAYR